MTGFGGNAEAIETPFHILHEDLNPLWNRSKVVVFKLLAFRRGPTKQRTSGEEQVWAAMAKV